MKELSIEEKVKAYDRALEIAKAWCKLDNNDLSNDDLKTLFPELKESEDDKVRKKLINLVKKSYEQGGYALHKWEADEMLAWLEKQGTSAKLSEEEQNRFAKGVLTSCALSFIDYLDAHKYEGKMCVSNGECEDIENAFHNAMWDRLHRYYCKYIEKQGEQSLANKVEPKFHEGEWITNGDYTWKIVEVKPLDYILQSQEGNIVDDTISHVDEQFHSFTIKDAKDGDVLVDGNFPFIFKRTDHLQRSYAYCGISVDYGFRIESEGELGEWTWTQDIKPATKEQRDTLEKAMADAGYTFDFEKKELKKIEDEEYNGEDYGIDGLWHAMNILEKTLGKVSGYQTDDGILEHKCAIAAVNKLYKQKPTWSQEDREYMESLLDIINGTPSLTPSEVECHKDWLKNLKQRIGGEQ